jgi:hypothetical protein
MRKRSDFTSQNNGHRREFTLVALFLGLGLLLSAPPINRYVTGSINTFIANLHAS